MSLQLMRVIAIGAFVLDGIAAVAYVAAIALGDRHVTPLSALVLAALLTGFFCALSSILQSEDGGATYEQTATLLIAGAAMFDNLSEGAKDDVRQHFPHRRASPSAGPPTEPDVTAAIDLELAQARTGSPAVTDLALGVH